MPDLFHDRRNPHAYLTAKEREGRVSFPTKVLWERRRIHGRVLDFGCGFGADVRFLQDKGFDATGYDPHHAPTYPEGRFDTILCQYVLNVLFPLEQAHVLMAVSELLDSEGTAYFAVRRDVRQPGFRMHRKHQRETYQCNVRLPYESAFTTDWCEIYAYRPFSRANHPPTAQDCPFCAPDADRALLTESATAYALFDKFPVADGHALVLLKRHVPSYFDLSEREQRACWVVAARTKEFLAERFQPDGFTVGINDGTAAGQTVPHAHIHVIPRYDGDVQDPTGGVRNVIPGAGDYRGADGG